MAQTAATLGAQDRRGRLLAQIAGFTFYLLAVQALLTAGVGLNVYLAGGSSSDLLLPATSALLAGCYVVVGYWLRRHNVWARNFAFAFAAASLFAFPVGTALGAFVILCIDQANRANVFQKAPRRGRVLILAMKEEPSALRQEPKLGIPEEAAVLRFEPELVANQVG